MKRFIFLILLALTAACAGGRGAEHAQTPLAELRRVGPATTSAELAGEWLLAELISPGGDARTAVKARARLDEIGGGGMLAHLSRGLDDAIHGRMQSAPDHYLNATRAARASNDPRAPMVAWFAANRAVALRSHGKDLWPRWQSFVSDAMKEPLAMGWRARAELVEWWADEAYAGATRNVEQQSAREYGCVGNLRLAGPFGRGVAPDSYRRFDAERPGPWPERWEPSRGAPVAPRILRSKQEGCFLRVDEPVSAGVFYVETFIELEAPAEVIVAAQGALALFVDDAKLLDRDPRIWGVWPRFGVHTWLEAGRHRVVARLADPQTSVRVLTADGRPAKVTTSSDAAAPYSVVPPKTVSDPNLVSRQVKNGDVVDPGDDLSRFLLAYLAYAEGQGDVAAVLTEPLLKESASATGLVLGASATFADKDPLFDQTSVRDLSRELHERALKKDPKLWQSELSLALWQGERAGPTEAVRRLRKLTDDYPQVSGLSFALARLYGELGWSAEYAQTAKKLAERFPDDIEALSTALSVYESQGERAKAEELAKRIKRLAPDSEVDLTRALAREDFAAATRELRRIGARHPERKDVAERLHDVLVRAGNTAETWKKLEAAINKSPHDGGARLALADARLGAGERDALRKALVDALANGAGTVALEEAIDLVEGTTELEHYRLDARKVIREYEASGVTLQGTAARVLDYAAIWVHDDGSSRMLEHEVVRIQSPEAIGKLAEHPKLEGVVLHARVIKRDGRVLEPEEVPGKPTITFPHLEVGDYIETEHVMTKAGDGRGKQYVSPHWFFREENIAYSRSEFVVIVPDGKQLEIETLGNVPPPTVEKKDGTVSRRWRVDKSPAAEVEPGSPPITEFLPSVRLGWGIELTERVAALGDSLSDVAPVDPRVRRIARKIVDPVAPAETRERARRLYRWVLSNVEEGQEPDGRRVVVSKRGNRWRAFMTLCRSLGIQTEYAVAKNRLSPESVGKITSATQFVEPLVRLKTKQGDLWLTVSSKFAPFAYVPAEVRGVPAYVLAESGPKLVMTPAGGTEDAVTYEGSVELAPDGSAKLDLTQRFTGKYAMAVRSAFMQLPESQLRDLVESKLLGRALRGARLIKHEIAHLDDLDQPLLLKMRAEMAGFAQQTSGELAISPPFSPRVAQLAALPARQTPLMIGEATHQEVRLRVQLPKGAALRDVLAGSTIKDGDRSVKVADRLEGDAIVLDRVLDIPAGRVKPEAYPAFLDLARRADAALGRDVRVRVGR